MRTLTLRIATKLQGGCRIVNVGVEATRLIESWSRLAENPIFGDWVAATKEYRQQREAEEEAEDAAKEGAAVPERNGHANSQKTQAITEPAA